MQAISHPSANFPLTILIPFQVVGLPPGPCDIANCMLIVPHPKSCKRSQTPICQFPTHDHMQIFHPEHFLLGHGASPWALWCSTLHADCSSPKLMQAITDTHLPIFHPDHFLLGHGASPWALWCSTLYTDCS